MDSSRETATQSSLLLRVRDLSDAEAWNRFVDIYAPRIYRWCEHTGLSSEDASDATQIVLTKLVTNMRDFVYQPESGRFRGWLKTVSRNVALDILRQWRERATGGTTILQTMSLLPDDELADALWQQVDHAHQLELMHRASENIKLRVKQTTWASYWKTVHDGLSASEVSQQLGISISEVYVCKSRVLKLLKEEVELLESLS